MSNKTWEIRLAKITGFFLPFITLRVDVLFYSITMYMLFILILCAIVLYKREITLSISFLDGIIYIFLLILLTSTIYSPDISYSLETFIKISAVLIFYLIIKETFKTRTFLIPIIMKYSIIGGVIMIMYLGYVYLIEFEESYIAINTEYATKNSKNALAFMYTIISGFIFSYLIKIDKKENFKIIKIILMIIGLLLMIAIQSRAFFILLLLYFSYFVLKSIWNRKFKVLLISIPVMIALVAMFVPKSVMLDISQRYSSLGFLFESGVDEAGNSLSTRQNLIDLGLNLFRENPFTGVGLGGFQYNSHDNYLSHNDYLLILSEQGLLGFLVFILLLTTTIIISYKNLTIDDNFTNTGLFLSLIGLSIYLLFINAYDNILLWSVIAFVNAIHLNYKHLYVD